MSAHENTNDNPGAPARAGGSDNIIKWQCLLKILLFLMFPLYQEIQGAGKSDLNRHYNKGLQALQSEEPFLANKKNVWSHNY